MLTDPAISGAKGPPFKSGRVYLVKPLRSGRLWHGRSDWFQIGLFDKHVENLRRWRRVKIA